VRTRELPQLKMRSASADLFLTFAKIGLFTFGGGYAMIPLIERETVDNHKWITGSELLDIVAIAESTPGPIAVNAATFIGKKVGGVFGAVCATAGVVLPSFVIIVAVSFFLEAFQHLKIVEYAFWGIRAGVLALILKALWLLLQKSSKDTLTYILMAASGAAVLFFNINAIIVIAACAVIGIVVSRIRGARR